MWDHLEPKTKRLIRGHLRQIFRWSEEKKQFLKSVRFKERIDGKVRSCVFCQSCGVVLLSSSKDYSVDHIVPCGTISPDFVALLFNVNNLQVLCNPCHDEKTVIDKKNIKGRELI